MTAEKHTDTPHSETLHSGTSKKSKLPHTTSLTPTHNHQHPPPRVMLNLFQHLNTVSTMRHRHPIPTELPQPKEILDQVQDDDQETSRHTAIQTDPPCRTHRPNPVRDQPAPARHAELVSASLHRVRHPTPTGHPQSKEILDQVQDDDQETKRHSAILTDPPRFAHRPNPVREQPATAPSC